MPKLMTKMEKAYSVIVKAVEGLNRTLRFTASTESIDRDGEMLQVDGWVLDNFRKNPVILWAHQYDEPAIGKAVNISAANGELIIDVEFADAETNPFADIVYRLYMGGFMSAVSVGFIPIEWEQGKKDGEPKRKYTKQELLELSCVPVPSNPEAVMQSLQASRTAKVIKLKELKLVEKSLEAKTDAPESKSSQENEEVDIPAPHSQGE